MADIRKLVVSNLKNFFDRDKEKAGVQFLSPNLKQSFNDAQRSFRYGLSGQSQGQRGLSAPTDSGGTGFNFFNDLANKRFQTGFKPLDFSAQKALSPINFSVDVGKGFMGGYQAIDVLKNQGIPEYKPTTTGEKVGSFGLNLMKDIVVGKNTGIDPSFDTGVAQAFQHPSVQLGLGRAKSLGASKLDDVMRFGSEKLDDVTRAIETPISFNKAGQEGFSKLDAEVSIPNVQDKIKNIAKNFDQAGPKEKGVLAQAYDDILVSTKNVIKRSGPSGEKIASLLDESRTIGEIEGGKSYAAIQRALKQLTPDEYNKVFDVLEGKIKADTPALDQATKTIRAVLDEIATKAENAGLDFARRENYAPHFLPDLRDEKEFNKYIKQLVDSGYEGSIPELKTKIRSVLNRSKQRRYGNLEQARSLDLPIYNKDPEVLYDYVINANQRIADAVYFGKDDRALYELANSVDGDPAQVTRYLDIILGKGGEGPFESINQKMSSSVRSAQTIMKLDPTTSLTNLTQQLPIQQTTDIPTYFKTLKQAFTDPETFAENAVKAGEITPKQMNIFKEEMGANKGPVAKYLWLIGMDWSEKFNRKMAVNAGINYAEKMVKQLEMNPTNQAARRELARLGVDVDRILKEGFGEMDRLKVGKKLSEITQFKTKPEDLPARWSTPFGKVLTQFKSFSFKQTGFVKDEVKRIYKESKKGNFTPLANSLVVWGIEAPIVGAIITEIKSIFRNKKIEETGFARLLLNLNASSSMGFWGMDALSPLIDFQDLQEGDLSGAMQGKYGTAGQVGFLTGPTGGDIASGYTNINKALEGKPDPLMRQGLRSIPIIGKTLANTVVPNEYMAANFGPNKRPVEDIKQYQGGDGPNLLQRLFDPTTGYERKYELKDVYDMPDGNKYERSLKMKEVYSKAVDIYGDDSVSDEVKNNLYKKLGVTKEDMDYYDVARRNNDQKGAWVMDRIESGEIKDRKQLLQFLAENRKEVNGKLIMADGILKDLRDSGIITDDEYTQLKNFKYSVVDGKKVPNIKMTGRGSGAKLKAIKLPKISTKGTKVEVPSIKAVATHTGSKEVARLRVKPSDTTVANVTGKPAQAIARIKARKFKV